MQIIIISPNGKMPKHWQLTPFKLVTVFLICLSIVFASATFINKLTLQTPDSNITLPRVQAIPDLVSNNTNTTTEQNDQVQAYFAKRLGGLQAETIRLKALTEKLAMMSGFDTSEFLLDEEPGQGGIDQEGISFSEDDFALNLTSLEQTLSKQSLQLSHLQNYLLTENTIKSAIPSGKPIKGGWISSYFGYRTDPFNGKKVFHKGVDFAGKEGSKVYAVADGIISWKGRRSGYGELVEIDHGNGYVTRYAHNKTVVADLGEKVSKGQVIALMGSTGRSTGPHVHFEVLRDEKQVNPYKFVKR
ncbi:MAG: M23 family metallopeptidase [Gammaproteobacteria bacterium]|nr:M23 family metallopeptidase [Gammaproteobacteria bacterium]